MLRTRMRIRFGWCGVLLALMLALGPLSSVGISVAAAQGTEDDAEVLLSTAAEMSEDLEAVDSPTTLDIEQEESDTITVNFLNSEDELIADFYLSFRAEAPRDGDSDPFDIGVYFRDMGNNEPYLNLILLSSGDDGPRWGLFNEDGVIETGDLDEDVFPVEAGTRYDVQLAVIGDEAAFAINGEPIALVDISDNPDAGRISLASGLFGDTQVDGDVLEVSRISLFDLGGGDDAADDEDVDDEDNGATDDDETTDDEDTASDDLETARSELYDLEISFDPSIWELRDITQTDQDYDSLGLANVEIFDFVDGNTQVLMFAGESEETPRSCVELDIEYFDSISSRYELIGIAEDEDGEPIEGQTSGGDGFYTVVFLDDNGPADDQFDEPEPITVYIECRPIVDGESMLLIEHYARDAEYNDAIENRIALLAGIAVGGSSGSDGDEDEPAEDEPVDDEPVDDEPVEEEATETAVADGVISVAIDGEVEGEATIATSGSTRSRVDVTVEGADEGALVVIQEGSCDDLAGAPAFLVGLIDDLGEASGRVRITPEELDGEYALTIVDADSEDYDDPLGCGDIG